MNLLHKQEDLLQIKMLSNDIYNWIIEKGEFKKSEFTSKFKVDEEDALQILKFLESEKLIIEAVKNQYMVLENAQIFKNKIINKILPELAKLLKNVENIQSVSVSGISNWDDIREIDKFVIFGGSERIYDIHINGRKIRLEGKEIMDYNIFRLRFFEEFGILLETYKGIGADWANLVTYWTNKYGEISQDKLEVISDLQEAEEMVIDYIENATISDNHIVKEGIICLKDDCLYVPTRIIKKLLKRNNLNVSLRKLAYSLNEYLLSGSIPLKIENRSERFWKFRREKFNIDTSDKLKLEKEEDV